MTVDTSLPYQQLTVISFHFVPASLSQVSMDHVGIALGAIPT